MAKRKDPIEETLSGELFNHWIDFIGTHGAVPIERAFWGWLISENKYTLEQLPVHVFRYWFRLLIDEGWIKIEPKTRSLIPVREVKIVITR